MTDTPQAKNITKVCPILSSAITFEIPQSDGTKKRVHSMARSPCIRGECEFFDLKTFRCGLVRA